MGAFEPPGVASSKTSTYADPELYRQALRNMDVEIVTVSRGNFRSELSNISFNRLHIQRGYEKLARIASVYNTPLRSGISFAARLDQAPTVDNGMEVSPGDIVFYSPGNMHHMRTAAGTRWAAMSLAPEDLSATGRAITGRELTAPAASFRLRPAPALMSRLMHLHEAAGQLAKTLPDILAQPEVGRALEQNLVHVMVRCLTDGTPAKESSASLRHAAILARLEAQLMANYDQPLHLTEVCVAIDVAERRLRAACQEQLGMGPIKYLWLRRMNLARRALLQGTPETTTVTEVATSHGFWELGRFAVRYRTLFGESPSASLARPRIDRSTLREHPFAFAGQPDRIVVRTA